MCWEFHIWQCHIKFYFLQTVQFSAAGDLLNVLFFVILAAKLTYLYLIALVEPL